jgi:hypothetical protein
MTKQTVPAMKEFDARTVQAPLQGLFRNMDCELARRLKKATELRDTEGERRSSLFLIMLRFTKNSYEAASFICSTMDETPKRKKEFALVLPPIGRQLLDLLFTLVFMMDDFPARSMDYERSGYRQAREEYDKFFARFGTHPMWQAHFQNLQGWLPTMERYLSITAEQRIKPTKIDRWHAPYRLMKKATKSKAFMEFLETWIYGETSAQAHLNAAGLLSVAMFLVPDFVSKVEPQIPLDRNLNLFTFRHFSRALATVLGIASEIENFSKLGSRQALVSLWVTLGGYAEEAKDMYTHRYQAMLT